MSSQLAELEPSRVVERRGQQFTYVRAFSRARLRDLSAGVRPALSRRVSRQVSLAGKRVFDILVASLGLAFGSPVFLAVWLLVISTSKGPALFWSERVGRDGRHFNMPKFRTLKTGTRVAPRESMQISDQEYTVVGKLLRRTSLDEMPQLLCVLTGDMSLIGPRPLLPSDPAARQRTLFPASLSVRPGITGLAQVSGRNAVTARRKARLDAFYARSLCLGVDLALLVKTLKVIVTGRGFR